LKYRDLSQYTDMLKTTFQQLCINWGSWRVAGER